MREMNWTSIERLTCKRTLIIPILSSY